MVSGALTNIGISALQVSISGMGSALAKKRADLARLQKALTALTATKGKFHEKKPLTLKPKLTAKTWHGKHAKQFEDIQKGEIKPAYTDLSDKQLVDAIDELKAAIEKLIAEIEALEASMVAAQASLSSLQAK